MNSIKYAHEFIKFIINMILIIVQSVKLKSFVCSKCGKGYSRNYRLQKQLEEEHDASTTKRERTFHCPMCNQQTGSFFTLLEMRKHCREDHQNDLGIQTFIHIYHGYIHAYIHTIIHTYVRTYLHTYIRMYLLTYIHTYVI